MAKGILLHRPDSVYDDLPEARYQFPRRYLSAMEQIKGDWIIYYEPRRGGGRMGYNAVARVNDVIPDPGNEEMFVAIIEPGSFVPFEKFVPFRDELTILESRLDSGGGRVSGLRQNAVRLISDNDFFRILSRAFDANDSALPRVELESPKPDKFIVAEDSTSFDHEFIRERVELTLTRTLRDRAFRKTVIAAYDETCALTGLKLINGGGRAEVEAAHIRPVAAGGNDSPRNGIALSGTVHWMFDRGLISLSDDLDLLVSRQVNNPDQIWALANKSRKANPPIDDQLRPHPSFLGWHRENCFKH